MAGFPACSDLFLRESSRIAHRLAGSFSTVYRYSDGCSATSCTVAMWQSSSFACLTACNLPTCLSSFGHCGTACAQGCQLCVSAQRCIQCASGFRLYFSKCVVDCPATFVPSVLDASLCVWDGLEGPARYYVTATVENQRSLGTSSDPFHSLGEALAAIHTNFTHIEVLQGLHAFTVTVPSAFLQQWDDLIAPLYPAYNIAIEGLLCTEESHPFCSDSPPTLVFNNQKPFQFQVHGKLILRNLRLTGRSPLLEGCLGDFCAFCPKGSYSGSSLVDEWGNTLSAGTFAPQSKCAQFHSKSFLQVTPGSSLYMANVTLADFLQEFGSLISLSAGLVSLTSVSFTNITVSTAAVLQTSGKANGFEAGFIVLRSVHVNSLNDPFKYESALTFGGFLQAAGIQSISILDCSLRYNLLNIEKPLIRVDNFLQFLVNGCQFADNVGITLLVSHNVTFPASFPSQKSLLSFLRMGVNVSDSDWNGNVGSSLVTLSIFSAIPSLHLARIRLERNHALDQAVLSVTVAGWKDYEKEGKYLQLTIETAVLSVFHPPRRLIFTGISVTKNSGPAIINLMSFANCQIADLTISDSRDRDLEGFAGKRLALSSWLFPRKTCAGVLVLGDAFGMRIVGAVFGANQCVGGPAGVLGTNLAGNFSIADSRFSENEGMYGLKGSILDLSSLTSVYLSNVSLISNTHTALQGKGLLHLTPLAATAVLIVTGSTFAFNTALEGGTVNVLGNTLVSSTAFTSNTCMGVAPAGLAYAPSPFGAFLSLYHILFASNSGRNGSALILSDSAASRVLVQLSITDCTFESNVSSESGSCLLIESSVGLTQKSVISGSVFQQNRAANACIWISYFLGILSIDNCVFRLNSATSTSVLYGQHPRSLTSTKCAVALSNSLIERNSGFATMYFNNPERYVEGSSRNLTVRSNIGRGMYNMYTYWQEQGSVFTNNSSPSSGSCLIFLFYCVASVQDSQFRDNQGKLTGGTMTVGILSDVLIANCSFVNNSAPRGGAIFNEQGATLNVSTSLFYRNRSTMEGSALYFLSGPLTFRNSSVNGCNFTENVSIEAQSALVMISSQVIVTSCYFNGNRATSAPGIGIFLSLVSILQSTFTNQTSQQGVFISASATSSVHISDCRFDHGTATAKGGAIYASSSLLWVSNSLFEDMTASNGAAIAAFSESSVVLANSVLRRQNATSWYGGVIYSNESPLQDLGNRYEDCWNGIIIGELVNIYIEGSVYSSKSHLDAYSLSGAGLFCRDCPLIVIKRATFTGLTAVNGACIHLPSTSVFGLLDLSFTTIQDSHADHTGALLLENVALKATQCLFANNSAGNGEMQGNGGAVSLFCPSKAAGCVSVIANSTFRSNTVSHVGGGVYWTDWKPTLTDITFEDNKAVYGPDIASFAIAISNSGQSALKRVPSGQTISDTLTAALVDHYGQVVASDSASLADLLPSDSNTTITGNTRVQAVQGVFTFQGFTITAKPNSTISIHIVTSGIDLSKGMTAAPEDHYQSLLSILVSLRPCVTGESLVEDTCYLCPEGKYSLSPEDSCAACPDGAICYGNSTMTPKSGYWRETNLTDRFLACPNKDACLGSPSGKVLYPTGVCEEGYYGNLCTGCLSQYSQASRNYCGPCPDRAVNIVQTTAISISFVLGVCGIIKFSLISAQKQKSSLSVFLKIFVNYLQLVAATSSFNMDWPSYAVALFNAHENVANVGTRAFSFDCLLDSGGDDNQAQAFYAKIVMVAVTPLGIILLAVLFWGSLALICQKKTYIKHHVVNSIVVAFFVAHPSIVSFSFDVFNCRQLNKGEYWLNSALNIRCWDRLHTRYSLIVALPSLILWGTLAPMLALLALISHRNNLISQEMRIRLGFLYTGYELRKYYWEFVILYRKIIVIALVVFLSNISPLVQALAVLFVLIVSLVVQARNLPYVTGTFNELEERGILVSVVTLYCGLFFVSDALDMYSKVLLFVAIVFANVYFLLMWLYRICIAGCKMLLLKIPFLSRFTSAYTASNDRVLPQAENQAEVSFSMDRSLKGLEGLDAPANSVLDGSVDRSSSLMRPSGSLDVSGGQL